MAESTRESLVSDADFSINLWLKDHPSGTYVLSEKTMDEIQDWGHTLAVYNRVGLKRRIGKILKEDGYIKRPNTSPPTWEKPGWVAPLVDPEPETGIVARIKEVFREVLHYG